MIENPILRGFNPDPSVIRIGGDYYIATSTFEWWPGVAIYHSRDLVNWRLHSRPLDRRTMLNLYGVPDSGGVWAPDLSYDGERVYLVYTNVRERGPMMQTDNYLVTADDINGEWSEPVYLNSLGFDPSLFHDADGRKWLLSLDNHYGEGRRFNGLYAQEYDAVGHRLKGELRPVYREPNGELVEGAHLYNVGGTYYLLKAQGGTGKRHSAQLSRAPSIFGPWEDCPFILLHSRDNASLPLQCAGHADIVDTPSGELYLVHLATRYSSNGRCIYGRETCIQRVMWDSNGWLRLRDGGENPHVFVPAPDGAPEPEPLPQTELYDFRTDKLPDCFLSLRVPVGDRAAFTDGGLRMRGADGLLSLFEQTLLARRIDSAEIEVSTRLSFSPDSEKHMAGLVLIYNTSIWHYLYVTKKDGKRTVSVLTCDNRRLSYPAPHIPVGEDEDVTLTARTDGVSLRFFCSTGGEEFPVGGELDMTLLDVSGAFTGAMVGIACQDLYRREKCADFRYMEYRRKLTQGNF